MATQIQLRRGNNLTHSTFTGAVGELTYDTTKNSIVIHDGSTAGGFPIALEETTNNISSVAQSARDTANSSVLAGLQIFAQANAAFDQANSAFDTIAIVFNQANAAFDQANVSIDSFARDHANAAFNEANNKLDSTGGTISGDLSITGNLSVTGNLVTINTTTLEVDDNMIYLNANNSVANPDLGFAGNYNDGTYAHAGLFRDADDGIWKFYDGYLPEPDASPYIDTANDSFHIATVQANVIAPTLTVTGASEIGGSLSVLGNVAVGGVYAEKCNLIATAFTTTNIYKLTDGVVHLHTTNSTGNGSISLSGFSGVNIGNSVSVAVITPNDTTPRYATEIQIDGTTTGVTTRWAGGAAPTRGNYSNTDIYVFNVIKTNTTTYTVFASQSPFGG